MEDLVSYIDEIFSSFEDLGSFKPFINQLAHKVYTDMKNGNLETCEKLFPGDFFSQNIRNKISGFSYEKPLDRPNPEYDIYPKKTKCVINPKTGRKIYKGGHLYDELLKDGWIDENGKHLKSFKVKRVTNPKTGKPITIGTKRFLEIVEEGWVDEEGKILKVINSGCDVPINSKEFQSLVRTGTFNRDGTRKK